MLAPALTLGLLSFALAWSVFFKAGVWPQDWDVTLCAVGCISSCYWLFTRPIHRAPPLSGWLRWPLLVFLCYLAFQLIPLPLAALKVLSPARAQLVEALLPVVPGIAWAPLSVNPPAAVLAFFTVAGYIATFLLVRELAWRCTARPWTPLIPLITIAALEAAIGMSQVFSRWPSGEATGTYTNRDHFAGLLEMLLPVAVLHGLAILRRRKKRFHSPALPAIRACALWSVAALLLLAIVYSLSRMGFLVALFVLFLVAAISIAPRRLSRAWRWSSLGLLAAIILLVLIFLPPRQLIERFAAISSTGAASTDTRLFLWKKTPLLISEFPIFGTGLGGFESTFLKYQAIDNELRVEFAHNDYLQYMAELGLVGFAILAAIVAGITAHVARGILRLDEGDQRFLLTGCAGALVAILLHSFVDFNTYIPANTMIFTWIAAVACVNASTAFVAITPRPVAHRHPVPLRDQKSAASG
jgi:O-antigen ligase